MAAWNKTIVLVLPLTTGCLFGQAELVGDAESSEGSGDSGSTGWAESDATGEPSTDSGDSDDSTGGEESTGAPDETTSSGGEPGWAFRRQLQFDAETQTISDVLGDVPVLVRLTPERFDYGLVRPDGRDIGFFSIDEQTPLPYEIERWEPEGESLLWVAVPAVGEAPNHHFWMYYGSEELEGWRDASEVWEHEYAAVWHFNDDNLTSVLDSTASGLAGVADPSVTAAVGRAGQGLEFDGTGVVTIPHDQALALPIALSLEAWVRPSELVDATQRVLWKASTYGLDVTGNGDQASRFVIFEGEGDFLASAASPEPALLEEWVYIAGTYDDETNRVRLYVDGVLVRDNGANGNVWVTDTNLRLGLDLVGVVDEVRVSRVARAPDWFAVQDRSLRDTLLVYGEQEVVD